MGKDLVIHSGGLEVVDEMFQLWRGGTVFRVTEPDELLRHSCL